MSKRRKTKTRRKKKALHRVLFIVFGHKPSKKRKKKGKRKHGR